MGWRGRVLRGRWVGRRGRWRGAWRDICFIYGEARKADVVQDYAFEVFGACGLVVQEIMLLKIDCAMSS